VRIKPLVELNAPLPPTPGEKVAFNDKVPW
jgi:hypothetical protein